MDTLSSRKHDECIENINALKQLLSLLCVSSTKDHVRTALLLENQQINTEIREEIVF